MMKIKNK